MRFNHLQSIFFFRFSKFHFFFSNLSIAIETRRKTPIKLNLFSAADVYAYEALNCAYALISYDKWDIQISVQRHTQIVYDD